MRRALLALVVTAVLGHAAAVAVAAERATGRELPRAKSPAEVGMSAERLSRFTAVMTSDHLPPGTQFGPATSPVFGPLAPTPEMGQGFGLGFADRTEPGRNPLHGSVGDYYWGGAYGTYFWVDPKEKLIAIFMMQAPAQRLQYRYLMRELVYQAIAD